MECAKNRYLKGGAVDDKLASHTHTLDHIGKLRVRVSVSEGVALQGRVPTSWQDVCSREICENVKEIKVLINHPEL
jgi:hypothetical protein